MPHHASSLPWLILQAHCISQECPHPDSCRGIWLIPLSVPIILSLFSKCCIHPSHSPFPLHSTLSTLVWELWQGVTASSCLLSVSLPLVSTPMRGQKGCILKDKWTRGPRQKKIFLTWDTLYWVSSSLICTACYAPAVVLAPVQCLIDSAALPSSSLSMYCSSALSFWQCGCNQT